ncbi:MAG: hypothetical protein HY609_03815 [Deltaproteobacteria bacterium]|nr:hypothetical protein [Deltaproteobacteria bacterium]MBI4224035.1 hypothetical protein [Deltaproteobacteria bacterium]
MYTTRVEKLTDLNPSVKLFRLKFQKPFIFKAGQFVMLHLEGGGGRPFKRAYSIASSPRHKDWLELCIRKVEGGSATSILFSLKEGDLLKVSGPLGKFQLNTPIQNDVIFVAGGTGIAPIRSMLDTLPLAQLKNKFYFYFGINTLDDFLFEEELKKIQPIKNFKLILVVGNDPRWKGDKGFISEEVMRKHTPDLSAKEIYMCGPPGMIRFIKAYLPNLGAKPEQIHIDAWE